MMCQKWAISPERTDCAALLVDSGKCTLELHKWKDPGGSIPGPFLGVKQPPLFRLPPHSNPWLRGTRSRMQYNTQRNARQPGLRSLCARRDGVS
jgi:hypothetical protein